jgi:predicted dehydrogenase
VYFAAGYHHTHFDIASIALQNDAYAVIEKPVATTMPQIKQMKELIENNKGNFFACFHKRYSLLNEWAKADLGNEPGEAIDYFCIVFEIPLPERHWYNWPNAGSRIVSNGCHWIDHFMYLNDYSEPVKKSVNKSQTGQITVFLELENKATFSMVLTDHGSSRLGVRDYIELRKGQTTVYMTDSSDYKSENKTGWIRKTRMNKIDAYRRMYATISKQIAENKPGDSLKSLSSSELVIELDQLLNEERQ